VCTDLLLVPFVFQNLIVIAIVMERQFHFGNIMFQTAALLSQQQVGIETAGFPKDSALYRLAMYVHLDAMSAIP
jgi:hypothetical protein